MTQDESEQKSSTETNQHYRAKSEEAKMEEAIVTFIGTMAKLVVLFVALLALSLGIMTLWVVFT